MNIYEVITLIIFVFSLNIWATGSNKNIMFYLSAFLILFMEAFRATHVGGDTLNYTAFFMGEPCGYGYLYDNLENFEIEIGYVFINRFLSWIVQEEWWFIFISSCFVLLPIFYRIKKYNSGNKIMSLCIFMTMWGLMTCSMTSLRQNFGISFVLIGLCLIEERPIKNKKMLYWVILLCGITALSCHSSIYITIPLLLIVYFMPMSKKIALVALVICMIIPILIDNFFGTVVNYMAQLTQGLDLLDRTMNYSGDMLKSGEFGLHKVTFFSLAPYAILVFSFIMLYTDKEIKTFESKCLIIGQCMYMLGNSFPMVVRAVLGVMIVGMVSVPVAFKRNTSKKIFSFVPIVMMVYYIYSMFEIFNNWDYRTGGGGSCLLPYDFIWE